MDAYKDPRFYGLGETILSTVQPLPFVKPHLGPHIDGSPDLRDDSQARWRGRVHLVQGTGHVDDRGRPERGERGAYRMNFDKSALRARSPTFSST